MTVLVEDTGNVIVSATEYGITVGSSTDAKIRYNLSAELYETLSVSSAGDYQLYLDKKSIGYQDCGSSYGGGIEKH